MPSWQSWEFPAPQPRRPCTRELEVHGVAWSKNASPDVLGRKAWRLEDVRDQLDQITLKGWVGEGDTPDTLIQDSSLGALLSPDYWLDVLRNAASTCPALC